MSGKDHWDGFLTMFTDNILQYVPMTNSMDIEATDQYHDQLPQYPYSSSADQDNENEQHFTIDEWVPDHVATVPDHDFEYVQHFTIDEWLPDHVATVPDHVIEYEQHFITIDDWLPDHVATVPDHVTEYEQHLITIDEWFPDHVATAPDHDTEYEQHFAIYELHEGHEDMDETYFHVDGKNGRATFESMETYVAMTIPASKSAIKDLEKVRLKSVDAATHACPICMEDFKAGVEATLSPSLHFYHGDCVIPWLEINHRCPLCRFPLRHD